MKGKQLYLWLLAAAAALVLISAMLLYFGLNREDTAQVLLPSPAHSGSPSEGLESASGSIRKIEVNPETVRVVLANLPRIDGYSRSISVETFWSEGSGVTSLSVWSLGGSERIIVNEGLSAQNILLQNGTVYVWYDDPSRAYSGKAASDDADRWQRIYSYEALLSEDIEITEAGYAAYSGEPCVFASFKSPAFGYDCKLYVSVQTGLLIGSETYEGGKPVLRMSSSAPDSTPPDSGLFAVPGMKQAG
jgi:hypothetical protein